MYSLQCSLLTCSCYLWFLTPSYLLNSPHKIPELSFKFIDPLLKTLLFWYNQYLYQDADYIHTYLLPLLCTLITLSFISRCSNFSNAIPFLTLFLQRIPCSTLLCVVWSSLNILYFAYYQPHGIVVMDPFWKKWEWY